MSAPGRTHVRGLVGVLFVIAIVAVAGIAARPIAVSFFTLLRVEPASLVTNAVTAQITILITALLVGGVGYLSSRRHNRDYLTPLVSALRSVAEGDFSVRVPHGAVSRGPLADVVTGVNEMAEALRRIDEMRREFVANVSHEIRSPLTSISGFAAALRTTDVGETERDAFLGIIETEARRLSRMSDDLLELSSLDWKEPADRGARVNLARQLREVIVSCEPLWQAKRLEIDARLEEVPVAANGEMLRRVWINVLDNAIKFSPDATPIVVRLAREGDHACVTVSDRGRGVDPDDLPHLFERFFKADRSRTSRGGETGSGLGLSIVKRIVELHGGTAEAASDGIGRGTTIRVTLPLREEEDHDRVRDPGAPR